MLSYSIVYRRGLKRFMTDASSAGFDGVILPDVPAEEAQPTADAARQVGLASIGLVAPTTAPDRRRTVVATTTGFVYQIAATGTTGERAAIAACLQQEVAALRQMTSLPICVGFGVSSPEHVREVCRFADGAIVGSALVRRIGQAVEQGADRSAVVEAGERFIAQLLTGLEADG
jgi:tryptophan synthase alpha chain